MSRIRRFKERSKSEQYLLLLNTLTMALKENPEYKKKARTDIYGVAKQYSRVVEKNDYDMIKHLTIEDLVKQITAKENQPKHPTQIYGQEIHAENCCKQHGCKFGSTNCPVVLGEIKQNKPCKLCLKPRSNKK